MLKAIYTLAKQDYKDSMKDGDEDVAMSGTHDNTSVYREPYIVKMRIRGCPTRLWNVPQTNHTENRTQLWTILKPSSSRGTMMSF